MKNSDFKVDVVASSEYPLDVTTIDLVAKVILNQIKRDEADRQAAVQRMQESEEHKSSIDLKMRDFGVTRSTIDDEITRLESLLSDERRNKVAEL